jgi:molybdenum storage protein
MALVRERDGRCLHAKSKLMGESLISKSFAKNFKIAPQQRLFPDVNVIKIGGQSICDRGKKALPGLIREIVANKNEHRMLITTGGGTRSRHIYAIGLELGMPTGIIAKFGSSVSEQNALLVSTLLSPWGGIKIGHDEIMKLPTYFVQDCIPVLHGMPPYDFFAIPTAEWRIPIHRTDVGTVILAELICSRICILVKDENVLYTDYQKKKGNVEFIPEISVDELLKKDLDDLIIERPCLEILQSSEVIDKIQIINGLEKGNLTKALNGKPVGTIIYK